MTVGEIIERIRTTLDDEVGTDSTTLWGSDELVEYLNEGIEKLCIAVPLLVDNSNANDADSNPLCTIPVVANTATYALSPKVLEVRRAKLSGESRTLTRTSIDILDDRLPGWEDNTGTPLYYLVDEDTGNLTLVNTPDADGTLNLTVVRLPLTELTSVEEDESPEIAERYHRQLKPYVLHKAYSKADIETANPANANKYLIEHAANIEDIRRDIIRRRDPAMTVRPRGAFI